MLHSIGAGVVSQPSKTQIETSSLKAFLSLLVKLGSPIEAAIAPGRKGFDIIRIRFSEVVDLSSVLSGLSVRQGGSPLSGSVQDPLPENWNDNIPIHEVQFGFSQPVSLQQPVRLSLSGVITPAGRRLDPKTFDSPSLSSVEFVADLVPGRRSAILAYRLD
jgi:hypothetical protein